MRGPRVIIIGGGFGGINVAKKLAGRSCDVLLIDKKNHHLFQPLLYQVASAALSPAEIATPLREIFRNDSNISVIMGNVDRIEKEQKQIVLNNGDSYEYDYLVVAVGARHSYFGHDAWENDAPGLKTITDALSIRERILTSFEKAERLDSFSEAQKYLNFIIIGGGPTGVEMAGSIAEIAHKTMFKNFRKINPGKSKIYLLEAADRLLPPYPPKLSQRAQKDLEKMGVRVMLGSIVTDVTADGVLIGDKKIEAKNIIWAAGNQASPLLKTLGEELDRSGRIIVEPDLSLPGFPEVFIIGDASHCKGKDGAPIPGVAPAAIQMARYVGKIIRHKTAKEKRKPFTYFDKGSLATIGTNKAVGFFGKLRFTGFIAWLAWGFIHISYLVGFRSRFTILLDWVFHYVTGMRGARLIHKSIDEDLSPKNE